MSPTSWTVVTNSPTGAYPSFETRSVIFAPWVTRKYHVSGFEVFEVAARLHLEHAELTRPAGHALPVRVWLVINILTVLETTVALTHLLEDVPVATAIVAVVHLSVWALVKIVGLLRLPDALDAEVLVAAGEDTWMISAKTPADGNTG